MIEGYEKKVSQLREENVAIKTKQKTFDDVLVGTELILNKVFKFLNNDKLFKENSSFT